jgi:transposase
MGLDPFGGAAYAFRNRRCDRIKLLMYDRTGFWLLMKRLEQDRFVWPRRTEAVLELTAEQLHWLLDGIDIPTFFALLQFDVNPFRPRNRYRCVHERTALPP